MHDAGYSVLRVGLLDGSLLPPTAVLDEPRLAEADPAVGGRLLVECSAAQCWELALALAARCRRVAWSARRPDTLAVVAENLRVSELFERGARLLKPFRSPP